jgi:hypothetical protein
VRVLSQQNVSSGADSVYRKKLFYDNGIRFKEIKARLINEYKPPTPVTKTNVNTTLQGASGLVGQGTSHYTATVSMLFYSKEDYASWLLFVGAEHKYYDEKGSIFLGLISGEPTVQTAEQETKYMVSINLILIRKQEFELRKKVPFTDTPGHWAEKYIDEMQQRGLVSTYDQDGQEVQLFRPDSVLTRAEGTTLLTRSYRYIDRLLRGY